MNLSAINIEIDARLDDNDEIHLGEICFRVITTPGHTSGGICLYCAEHKLLFSGDTLLKWPATHAPAGSTELSATPPGNS